MLARGLSGQSCSVGSHKGFAGLTNMFCFPAVHKRAVCLECHLCFYYLNYSTYTVHVHVYVVYIFIKCSSGLQE